MKRIILTGGGSAGHVNANIALIPELIEQGWEIHYIGTKNGMEAGIVPADKVQYHAIRAGKLRRYFDIKNFIDPFNVLIGAIQSFAIIRRLKPSVIFSKGGFVSLPVVLAGWLNRVPVIIHEGDTSIGLANKLSFPFAKKVCVAFPETMEKLPKDKACFTGMPVRRELFDGNREQGLKICCFSNQLPVVMVVGGSQGSANINRNIRAILPKLLGTFQVVHICGNGNLDTKLGDMKGYKQFEYIKDDLPNIFAMADVVISRAGTNSVFELLALKKPALLIPLSTNASRGEQITNAKSFENQGFSKVLLESDLTGERLYSDIFEVYRQKEGMTNKMSNALYLDSIKEIMKIILQCQKKVR